MSTKIYKDTPLKPRGRPKKSTTTYGIQKEIADYYLAELSGLPQNKAQDILELIDQAKALKSMCYNESLKGNHVLMRNFVELAKLIMDSYDNLPATSSIEEKVSIEQAISALFGTKEA